MGKIPERSASTIPRKALRILVADDDPVNRRLDAMLLERAGFENVVVDDGLYALEVLRSGYFDLILLDLDMPGLSGLETAKRIRGGVAGEHQAGAIILALTGYSGDHDHKSCLDAGMEGVLSKPLEMHDLAPWLAKALAKPDG
ncbi:MAG: response regulator [Desulfovibrio sp.]|nr:response regulator [Desulfovibrio sp.]MBI4960708.1 response regulator [Desulfovibrio sp.]